MLILLTYFSFHQLSLLRKLHGALRKLSDLWRNHSSFITPASLLEQDGNTTCPLLPLSLWIWQQLDETVWRHYTFCFTPVLVGWFHATNSVMQQAIAVLLIRIFLKFFSNEFLAMFGALSGITYFVNETAAHSTLMLFLGKTFYYIVFCMIFDHLIHNGLLPARSVV